MRTARILSAITGTALAGMAAAGPRDSGSYTNLNSDGLGTGSPSLRYITTTGSYTTRYVRITGQLQAVIPGTFAAEACLRLESGVAGTSAVMLSPSPVASFTTLNVDTFLPIVPTATAAAAPWQMITFETSDDGPGADAHWNTLTVTLNDGPPESALDLGQLSSGAMHKTVSIGPGETKWFRFSVPGAVEAALGRTLTIDTVGTALVGGSNDTEMAVYNEGGFLVGYNDDAVGLLSRVRFGLGGPDGNLGAGSYYLGVRGYNGTASVGWDFANVPGVARSGPIAVNISTNFGSPAFCAADFNKSGGVSVQDLFDFLAAWFGGCS